MMSGTARNPWLRRGAPVCGLLLCLLVLVACPEVQRTVPTLLRGTWVADGGGYEGRVMKIEQQQISFDSGMGDRVSHQVLGVFFETKAGEDHYAVDYVMEEGGEYRLHLIYEPESDELRLANRRQVTWMREEG